MRAPSASEPLAVGSKAPDFELDATGKRRIKLSALLRQGPAALFFYPGNNTPG
jgi:peroxiredoxin